MSLQGDVETRCPSCGREFEAPVWSFVHGGRDEALRERVKARECNLLLCPACEAAFTPEVPWVYYEPEAEILAFVFPESFRAEEARWRGKMREDFAQMRGLLGDRLPVDLEPEVYFGSEGLAELLEAEDWRRDERDVMEHYARELGLSLYRASPRWARAHAAPSELPYRGGGRATRAALLEGLKALVAANDRLAAWSDYLAALEKDAAAGPPPPAAAAFR
ncbi:MAG: hypothetical protein HY552_03125 [Elusimicrobia bacterium]|nr:hypothetical protein [Elusimicrobiota bacterium]